MQESTFIMGKRTKTEDDLRMYARRARGSTFIFPMSRCGVNEICGLDQRQRTTTSIDHHYERSLMMDNTLRL